MLESVEKRLVCTQGKHLFYPSKRIKMGSFDSFQDILFHQGCTKMDSFWGAGRTLFTPHSARKCAVYKQTGFF
jgi:hypothetical protein